MSFSRCINVDEVRLKASCTSRYECMPTSLPHLTAPPASLSSRSMLENRLCNRQATDRWVPIKRSQEEGARKCPSSGTASRQAANAHIRDRGGVRWFREH